METKKQTAIIIGRFQVPYLHLGHIYLISHALQNYGRTVIFLGESPYRNERNPYSPYERKKMIEKVFGNFNEGLSFFVLHDEPDNDEKWSNIIDGVLSYYSNPVLLHSRDSFKDHYKGKYPLVEIPELPGYSGTEVRKQFSHAGVSKKGTGPGTNLNIKDE